MKKKGFTLIELLAVIIILAILAFILIPIIQDLIANARYGAAANSVMNYVNAANTQAAVEAGGFEEYKLNLSDTYELDSEIDTEELNKIKFKGKGPTYVYLLFSGEEKYVSEGHFCMWGYSIDYNFETGTSKSDLDYCGGESQEPEGELTCDVLSNNAYDSTEVFKIKKVEDLVCVSELAKTKTFENKTIYLVNNIDINNSSSYNDPNNTTYGDINGNGEVEGLKTELTTGAGFYPINSSSVPFKGLFEGYAKSISNLMVNRSQDNVGLFGYNQGIIRGFTLSSNITGNNNVGGVVGVNRGGTINEIIYTGTVTSSGSATGGIAGALVTSYGKIKNIYIKNLTMNAAGSYRSGIVGYCDTTTGNELTAVIENGTFSNSAALGYSGYTPATNLVYGSNSIVNANNDGGVTRYTLNTEMLSSYDKVLDTYIGGDNDNSGYYFDYENETSSNIILKRTEKNPIKFTVKGAGTESDPYIIDSVQHYKETSILAGSNGSYKFKITKDLDFTGRHYYALGTNGNDLKGDIDGDMHTLSNISFACAENCGLVSQNNGHTIEGLNLNNITITSGDSTIGTVAGINKGTIKGITATGITVNGTSNVGGIVGSLTNGNVVEEIVFDGTISTPSTGSATGGIVGVLGGSYNSIRSILIKNLTLNTSGSYRAGIYGYGDTYTGNELTAVIENGTFSNLTALGYTGYSPATNIVYGSNSIVNATTDGGGLIYTLNDEILNAYDKVLDTYIGGDNDNSGYYFDYENDSSSNIVIKRTKDEPINFTLSGSGTSEDPYIIDSYQHYKEATIKSNGNYVFKFTADIDFSGKHYYALGTNGNILGSDINGDMHTLSNISFACAENCGLVSQNSRTIEGLNLNNVTITSSNDTVGGIAGTNTGTIKGMNITGMNITGANNLGGIVGNITGGGTINEIAFDGTVTSVGSATVGGIAGGLSGAYNTIKNILIKNLNFDVSVAHRAGMVGYGDTYTGTTLVGVIERGTFSYLTAIGYTGHTPATYKVYGSNLITKSTTDGGGTIYTLIPPTTVSVSGAEIDSLTYYDSQGVLDTVIGGDNDDSGYYLQYNNSGDSIIVVKAGTPSNPSNPGTTTPDSPVAITGTPTGTNPPTCVLNQVIPRSAGIQAVLTCEDEEGAPIIRSQWNVNAGAPTNTFADIGIVKNGTVNGNSKTVRPYWSTNDPISIPHRGDCYYYRFGAQDASGNWTYYVTNECYHAFLD